MKIVRVLAGGVEHLGRQHDDGRVTLLEGDLFGPLRDTGSVVQVEKILAPLEPRDIICVGLNYRQHAAETGAEIPSHPVMFMKNSGAVQHPGDPILLPRTLRSDRVDYEAELAVVIGRGGRNVPAGRAMEHVWGYTIVNDVTARDVQMRHQQWDLGKSFDTFCPMGPWLVDVTELDGRDTRVRAWVNGELRQDARTTDLIFDIPTLIETISRGITLYPGDVIATGTPAGVGMGMSPPRWLAAGDIVRVEIDGIGMIENRVVA